jgi:hypothetical protein
MSIKPQFPDIDSDEAVEGQLARAGEPAVQTALALVHEVGREILRHEGNFNWLSFGAIATCLEGWQVSEACELFRRVRLDRNSYRKEQGLVLAGALRGFLAAHYIDADQLDLTEPYCIP